jgi:hypothetical protein
VHSTSLRLLAVERTKAVLFFELLNIHAESPGKPQCTNGFLFESTREADFQAISAWSDVPKQRSEVMDQARLPQCPEQSEDY